jgi:hypothetical protein
MSNPPKDQKSELDETKRVMARLASMPHKPHAPLKKKSKAPRKKK